MTPVRLVLAILVILACRASGADDKPILAAPVEVKKSEQAMRAVRRDIVAEHLLQHFTIGVEAPLAWLLETQQANGCRFATNAMYLSAGVEPGDNGDRQWFFKYGGLENQIKEAKQAGIMTWFTWFMLGESAPSHYKPSAPAATQANAVVPSTMLAYWTVFKRAMETCGQHPEVPICVQIEPDEWGHLLIASGWNPKKEGVVLVGSSGLPELKGLPDSVAGWAAGFKRLRDLYAPRTLLCANPSAWDRPGKCSGAAWVGYFRECGVTADGGWDLFVAQLHDWDHGLLSNGASAKMPPYTEADTVSYHGSWNGMCEWIKAIHDGIGLPCCLWQLPIGNAYYRTCDGSPGHGCDNIAESLLEDYPRNDLASRMVAAGCCMWIFSHGGLGASAWDANKDGITNPPVITGNKGHVSVCADDDGGYLRLKAAVYFKHPVPILGKSRGRSAGGNDSAAGVPSDGDKPADAPKAARAATLADQAATTAFGSQLRGRIKEELAIRRTPTFTYHVFHAKVRIDAFDQDTLKVRMEDGAQLDLPWASLGHDELLELALFQIRDQKPEDHALAAFYLLLANRVDKADEQLGRAGGFEEPVRKAFTIQ